MQREHPLSAVRFRRDLLGIKASYMAREVGLEPASYSRIERGERRCYLDKAIAIASILHCTVDDLRVIPDEAERLRLWSRREDNAEAIKTQAPAAPEEIGTVVSNTAPQQNITTDVISAADLAAEWADDDEDVDD